MAKLLQDLHYAVRVLRNSPGFTISVLATLALGIGANTAVFSLVNGILLRPLPFEAPEQLWMIWSNSDGTDFWNSAPNYRDVAARSKTLAGVAALSPDRVIALGDGGPESIRGAETTINLFDVLGVEIAVGRDFVDEDRDAAVVIISDALARRQFGSPSAALGRQLNLDGLLFDVLGIAPAGRLLPQTADLWVPIRLGEPSWRQRRGIGWVQMVGRQRDGMTADTMRAELAQIGEALAVEFPDSNADQTFVAQSVEDDLVGATRRPLAAMMAAVALVLLVACANVAGLHLAWAQGRRGEIAVRVALGGGRRRIVRQLLTESLVIAIAGGVLGLGVGYAALRSLVALAPPDTPRLGEAGLDATTLFFCTALTLSAGLVFGLAPAARAARLGSKGPRAELARAVVSDRSQLRAWLVVAQVALAVVLVVGSTLLIRSFWTLRNVDPGFEPAALLTVGLPLVEREFDDGARRQHLERLLDRARVLPGVEVAALVNTLPLRDQGPTFSFELRVPPDDPDEQLLAGYRVATPEYFRTMGISVLEGRTFDLVQDGGEPGVAIIDEAFARRYFAGRSAVGQELYLLQSWRRIVGVVDNVRDRSLADPSGLRMYVPFTQAPRQQMTLVTRVAGAAETRMQELLGVLHELAPRQALVMPMTMEAWVSRSIAQPRFTTIVLTFFGMSSLLLATVGLYGLLAHTVAQRAREIGIRMAVGAASHQVRRLVAGQGLRLVVAGLLLGTAIALATSQLLASLLYEVEPHDTLSFAAVALILLAVATVATYLPARRASRVDPVQTLRGGG